MRLTASTIKALTLPEGVSEKTFFDDDLPGFGVRIRASGSKSFVIQYKTAGRHRRVPLGSVAAVDLGKARAAARDLLAAVRTGHDPAGEKVEQRRRAAFTVGSVLPRFLERQRQRLKPRSFQENRRHLEMHAAPLHGIAIDAVDRATIAVLLAGIAEKSGPVAANRVRSSISAFFNWAAREGLVAANVAHFTNKAPEGGGRTRVLVNAELAAIWNATDDGQYGSIVKLLMLTGARRDEIASLRWSEVDFDKAQIVLGAERTKSRREHAIPMSPAVVGILQSQPRRIGPDGAPRDLVFGRDAGPWQDWSGSKRDLDVRIDPAIPGWRLHDFRRSLSTTLHERFGVMPHVVEALLGHAGGHRAGVAGVYNRAAYLNSRRIALEKWADHVVGLATGEPPSRVVTLRRA